MYKASQFSLADFYLGDSDDPVVPPADFTRWRHEASDAAALYEQSLLGAPLPRTTLLVRGQPRTGRVWHGRMRLSDALRHDRPAPRAREPPDALSRARGNHAVQFGI